VCDIVVAAGMTVEFADLEVPPQTVEDSEITVPSYKRDSLDERSALNSEIDKQIALTSKIDGQSALTSKIDKQSALISNIDELSVLTSRTDEQSTLASKPTTPSGTKLPPDSAMTVMQGHTAAALSPPSVLLAKHWGPERMVQILREPNCSLGISIVGGKVRYNY
jgi:hypothetical protein